MHLWAWREGGKGGRKARTPNEGFYIIKRGVLKALTACQIENKERRGPVDRANTFQRQKGKNIYIRPISQKTPLIYS